MDDNLQSYVIVILVIYANMAYIWYRQGWFSVDHRTGQKKHEWLNQDRIMCISKQYRSSIYQWAIFLKYNMDWCNREIGQKINIHSA